MATVRTSCKALLSRLRNLIRDTDPDCQTFTQDQLQTALDQRRERVRYLELEALETRAAGGAVSYVDFQACLGDWDADAALVDGQYNALTPNTENLETGEWSFTTEPSNLPVYLSGFTYDLYGAAADLLEEWAAKVKTEYTFSPGSGQHVRSQQHQMLLVQAERYRALQRVTVARMFRSDVNA